MADNINSNENIDLLRVCQHLRNKKMSYLPLVEALAPSKSNMDGPSLGTGNHQWCFHTQGPVGPDGGFVSLERCMDGRKCHCPY